MRKRTIFIILDVFVFIIGCFITWNLLAKPMNEDQFVQAEQIARNISGKSLTDILMYDTNNNFTVDIITSKKEVKIGHKHNISTVVASIKDGKLVITRKVNLVQAYVFTFFIGLFLVLIVYIFQDFYSKISD